jgi:leucyl/phenylalanyl-tRNA--protein transferase
VAAVGDVDVTFRIDDERRTGRWDAPPSRLDPSKYVWPDAGSWPTTGDVVARGADLEPSTLIDAYRRGLFPMEGVDDDNPTEIYWWSPQQRGIIPLDGLRVSRSMRRSARRYSVRINHDFVRTVRGCASRARDGARVRDTSRDTAGNTDADITDDIAIDIDGEWITERFVDAYARLHELGWAHSIETYDGDGVLVGGLYGVRIGGFFAGESMFHLARDASKVALMALVRLMRASNMSLLDTQWLTPHLASLGAVAVPRHRYLGLLASATGTG